MRLAIILLMCGAAWGQMPTVQEICAVMEPATRAKTEACTHMQQSDKHPARKDPRNFVDAPPITQTRDIYPSSVNIITKPGCEATVENDNIIVAPTKPDTTSCIRGKTCPGLVIGQPEAPGYVEITEADGKMHRVCPKYQHVEPTMFEIDCGIDPSRNCTPHCVDDPHTVTEREWAELMARLKALEHPIVVDGTSAGDCKTPPDDPTKPCDKNQPSRKGKK